MSGGENILQTIRNVNRILRVAHRGAYPENTLVGFQKAVEDGCDMFECDIRLSSDNHPVVIHDKTINRTTNGKGFVASMKLHELQFYGIPSLEELLMWFSIKNNILGAFELKNIGKKNAMLLNKTLSLLEKYNVVNRSILISFNTKLLALSKSICPQVCTGIVLSQYNLLQSIHSNSLHKNPIQVAMTIKADVLWVSYKLIPTILYLNSSNMPIFIWTVNNKKDIVAIDKNVVGILSDDINKLYKN